MDIEDEEFKAIEANLTDLQKNILMLLNDTESTSHESMATKLGVPILHVHFACLALKGMGLIEN